MEKKNMLVYRFITQGLPTTAKTFTTMFEYLFKTGKIIPIPKHILSVRW